MLACGYRCSVVADDSAASVAEHAAPSIGRRRCGAAVWGVMTMRGLRAAYFVLPLVFFAGQQATAQNCPDQGLQYIYDVTVGRQAMTVVQFPPQPNWPFFMHPTTPVLAFYYPSGWQAVPLQQGSAIGVRGMAPDGAATFQIYATPPPGAITSQQAAQMSLTSLLGQGAQIEILCGQDVQLPGLYPVATTFLGVASGNMIGAAVAQVTYDPSTGGPVWVDMRTVIAPAQQFGAYLTQAFLPVFAQLQGGGGGGGDDDGNSDSGDDDGGDDDGGDDDG
ncbi:MAG: hypothetical protein R3F55_18230 [Alphaproteobacteria bacterium]